MCILPLVKSVVICTLFVSLYVHSVVYVLFIIFVYEILLLHGRTRTAYLYRCVWSGITG